MKLGCHAILAALLVIGLEGGVFAQQMEQGTVNQPRHSVAVQNVVARQLIGTWRLVSRVTRTAEGQPIVDPGLGARPVGYLIYDTTGHVAAQLMRPGRSSADMENCGSRQTKAENNPGIFCGYDAYFGTYAFDGPNSVVHHLEMALSPDDVGRDVHRSFSIKGNRLTITFATTAPDGRPATRTLIWERVQ